MSTEMTATTTLAGYSHTQRAPLFLVLYGSAVFCFVLAWQVPEPGNYISAGAGLLVAVLGLCFQHLAVMDRGDVLALWFGPIPLFRRSVRYADIRHASVSRTSLLDGWGIHYSLRGGWVWNIWGRSCVEINFKTGGKLFIGTDDADQLAAFLNSRVMPGGG